MNKIRFDKNFIFGVSGAAYQFLGAQNSPHCNWSFKSEIPGVADAANSGGACGFWNHLNDDIDRMKELGIKAFRFSFEWSDIEPIRGSYDKQALENYHRLFKKLSEHHITPWMTLHHFTHPMWFEQLGGFEKEENLQYFIDFCHMIVKEFGDHVTHWGTFNEPGMYIFNSYVRGKWPPGVANLQRAGTVLQNMLHTHVAVYEMVKKMQPHSYIGFMHNIMPFKAYNYWNPIERMVCYYVNHIFHDSITDFFVKGKFNFSVPFFVHIKSKMPQAKYSFDFFGLNYYSCNMLRMNWRLKNTISFECPANYTPDYGVGFHGLYHVIKNVHAKITGKRKIPIYITENGIADGYDLYRKKFIEESMMAVHKAVKKGFNVKGYFYWSFMDNLEWDLGYVPKFGLYEVNFDTQERTLRKGAQPFLDIIERTYKAD
jgi:beta-glucosidase